MMKDIEKYSEVRKRCTICKHKNTEDCNDLVSSELYKKIKKPLDMYLFADKFLCSNFQSMFSEHMIIYKRA